MNLHLHIESPLKKTSETTKTCCEHASFFGSLYDFRIRTLYAVNDNFCTIYRLSKA